MFVEKDVIAFYLALSSLTLYGFFCYLND